MGLYFTLGIGVNSMWNTVTGVLIDTYGASATRVGGPSPVRRPRVYVPPLSVPE